MAYSISISKRPNLAAVIIWANVEVDVAIACGSYNFSHESQYQS